MARPLVLPLEAACDPARCGGKAASLARLARTSLPVPRGLVVVTEAWVRHTRALSAATGPGEATADSRQALREASLAKPLPATGRSAVETALGDLAARAVAVRSSATGEDSGDHSFAGLHDTVLGVVGIEACLEAVKTCWASVWSEQAYHYREARGVAHDSVAMAVGIQEQVASEVSGVLFTADPTTGARGHLVVEATYGLGETLVQGRVSPDRWLIGRADSEVLERTVGAKDIELVATPGGGTAERPVDLERRGRPALSDAEAIRAAETALRIERLMGLPVDVEFALAHGRLFVLQARPITGLDPADRQVWTNANTGEVLPDVVTPMTWSVAKPIAEALLGGVFAMHGARIEGLPVLGLIGGRAYFNVNTLLACMTRAPGGRKAMGSIFGGQPDRAAARELAALGPEDLPRVRLNPSSAAWHMASGLWCMATLGERTTDRALKRARAYTVEAGAIPAREPDAASRVIALRDVFRALARDRWLFAVTGVSQMDAMLLYGACGRWFADDGNAVASRMLAGTGANDNAEAGLALLRLAHLANRDRDVRSAVEVASDVGDLRERLAGLAEGAWFVEAFEEFLFAHGHHCRGELELTNPRWAEQPDYVFSQVRMCLQSLDRLDSLERYERAREEADNALTEARGRLTSAARRWALSVLVRRARRFSPLRESVKSEFVRLFANARRLLLGVGRELVREGRLTDADDVFFLGLDELVNATCGRSDWDAARADIAVRRTEHAANSALNPPPVVVGRFRPERGAPVADRADEEGVLRGIPVNPGLVTAPARVILLAGEDYVRPGEVLVVPFTDPGWTPYFLNAAAIVMDQGGILSHGAIVARELGIPAVANGGNGTRVIRSGQMLEVDGAHGAVRVL